MIPSLLLSMHLALAARLLALFVMVRYRKAGRFPFLALFLGVSSARTAVLCWHANDWQSYMAVQDGTRNTMVLLMIAVAVECWVLMWRHDSRAAAWSTAAAVLFSASCFGVLILGNWLVRVAGPIWFFVTELACAAILAGCAAFAFDRFRWHFEMGQALRSYAVGLFVLYVLTAIGYGLNSARANVAGAYVLVAGIGIASLIWARGMKRW